MYSYIVTKKYKCTHTCLLCPMLRSRWQGSLKHTKPLPPENPSFFPCMHYPIRPLEVSLCRFARFMVPLTLLLSLRVPVTRGMFPGSFLSLLSRCTFLSLVLIAPFTALVLIARSLLLFIARSSLVFIACFLSLLSRRSFLSLVHLSFLSLIFYGSFHSARFYCSFISPFYCSFFIARFTALVLSLRPQGAKEPCHDTLLNASRFPG